MFLKDKTTTTTNEQNEQNALMSFTDARIPTPLPTPKERYHQSSSVAAS